MDYIFASSKNWAINAFLESRSALEGSWLIVTNTDDLKKALCVAKPRYIFFPHWSEIVPAEITRKYDCVCFHMTDVPFGRGGSPLQNLIKRGIKVTKLTALKMEVELDAGPVYKKDELALTGSAEQIFVRMSKLAMKQIQYIIRNNPTPIPQSGENLEIFKRRGPSDSEIKGEQTIEELYDHIRMLDAPGYPNAFLRNNGFNYEFSTVSITDERKFLKANVRITRVKDS